MDAVAEAKDLDSASEEFMIAALMKKLTALKANKTKFAGEESADDEFLIKAMLAKLVALKRNKVRERGKALCKVWGWGVGGSDFLIGGAWFDREAGRAVF